MQSSLRERASFRPRPAHAAIAPAGPMAAFAAAILMAAVVGCSDENRPPTQPPPPQIPECGRLLVVTTDYSTGAITVVDADSSYRVTRDVAAVHSDAVARVHGGLLYVVNRLGGDNVQVVDPADGFRTVRQFSVGGGTNPRDIAFAGEGRAYVSRGGSASILKVEVGDGSVLGEISLSVFADGDGVPDMDRLLYIDPYLYVAVQRIDFGGATYLPVPPSYLAIIDTRADSLVDADPTIAGIQGIVLQGLNPTAPMVLDRSSSFLLVPESGVYGVLDAGIEKVDLSTWRSAGFMVREEILGGDLIDFALTDEGVGYATVSDPSFVTSLVSFNAATGVLDRIVHRSNGYELADLILLPCGDLAVCDRNYADPGLRIFSAANGVPRTDISQPLPTGLPPFELVLITE